MTLLESFYNRNVTEVAHDLIGKLLCRRSRSGLTTGRIVETEAYLSEGDSAAHSHNGLSRKNASMFGLPGRSYVYTIHARQCFNVVTDSKDVGSAVLIRALEPIHGVELMHQRRQASKTKDLCRGPARLCEAFDIGRNFDGYNLTKGERLWIEHDDSPATPVTTTVRIGVTSAEDLPLRFIAKGSEWLSGSKRHNRKS